MNEKSAQNRKGANLYGHKPFIKSLMTTCILLTAFMRHGPNIEKLTLPTPVLRIKCHKSESKNQNFTKIGRELFSIHHFVAIAQSVLSNCPKA